MTRKLFIVVAAAALLATVLPQLVSEAQAQSGGSGSGARIEGIVVGINLAQAQVALRTQSGAVAVIRINALTRLERNGVRVPLSAFRLGDRGQARFTATGLVERFEAVGP